MAREQSKIIQDYAIILKRLEHNIDKINATRAKYGIPRGGLPYFAKDKNGEDIWETGGQPIQDWESSLTREQSREFELDLGSLMDELQIGSRFYMLVLNFIREGENDPEFFVPPPARFIDGGIRRNPISGRNELILVLDADIKKSDLQSSKLWSWIQDRQRELSDYGTIGKQKIFNLEVLEKMYQWHYDAGLTYKEINEKLPEIGEKSFSDYQSIGTYLSRYKKIVGINKTRKKKK